VGLVCGWVAVQLSLPDSLGDVGSVSLPDVGGGEGDGEVGFTGFHGGDAGGGGSSDLFDAPVVPSGVSVRGGGGSGGGGGFGFDLGIDLDEGFWILLVLAVLVIIIAGAGGYLIWMAPEILPEIALECAVGAGLVRQLKDNGRRMGGPPAVEDVDSPGDCYGGGVLCWCFYPKHVPRRHTCAGGATLCGHAIRLNVSLQTRIARGASLSV
jgi:hypothetical protein